MDRRETNYYEARGFSACYFANAIFNIVLHAGEYLRGIEEILGDAKTEFLMRPFKQYTNLHEFIQCVSIDILIEGVRSEDCDSRFLKEFLKTYEIEYTSAALEDEDAFAEFMSESGRFHDATDELTDEVFHILFNDVGFLQNFNKLCAGYIGDSGFGEDFKTSTGALKRVQIPIWARRAIFYRDKGECRACKRSLLGIANQFDTERYDHIVPLAQNGANDITNLQLLCEQCNTEKSANDVPVSRLYQRAIRPRRGSPD